MVKYGKRRRYFTKTRRINRNVVQKKRRAVKVGRLRLNPVVTKLVDRRILSKQEKHYRVGVWANNYGIVDVDGAITRTNGFYTLLTPDVVVGDFADQRTGNEIIENHREHG